MNIDRRKRVFKRIYQLLDGRVYFTDPKGYVLESSLTDHIGNYIDLPEFGEGNLEFYRGGTYRKLVGHDGKTYILVIDNKKQSTITMLELVSMLFEEEMDDLSTEEVLIDFLKGRIEDDVAIELAAKVSADFERKITVCVLEHRHGENEDIESILRNIVPEAHILPYDKNRFVIINRSGTLNEDVMGILSAISEELLIEPRIGVGTQVDGFLKIRESFEDAVTALNIAKIYKDSEHISHFKDLALPMMIDQLDGSGLNRINKAISGNIHAVIDDEELILTAQRFFEHSLNVTDTAQVLFIHRNTLIYRLNKIEKLTGFDLRKFEDALNFYIGLYMYNRMNRL